MQQPDYGLKSIACTTDFLSNTATKCLQIYFSTIIPADNTIKVSGFKKDLSEKVFILLLLVVLPVITLLSSDG